MNTPKFHDQAEGRVFSKSTNVLRLERNYRDLLQLNRMLSCYRCEPKTYDRFEELAQLKMRLRELRKSNLGIISAIHSAEEPQTGNMGKIRKQLLESNALQKRVVRYSNPIRSVG